MVFVSTRISEVYQIDYNAKSKAIFRERIQDDHLLARNIQKGLKFKGLIVNLWPVIFNILQLINTAASIFMLLQAVGGK